VSISLEAGLKLPGALLFIRSASAYASKPHQIGHVAIPLWEARLSAFAAEATAAE